MVQGMGADGGYGPRGHPGKGPWSPWASPVPDACLACWPGRQACRPATLV